MARVKVTREEKAAQIDELVGHLQDSASVVVVDYLGLTVSEITELRKELREAGVKMQVVKNTMLRRAADAANIEGLDEVFSGPTAIAYHAEDPVVAAKILVDSAKNLEALSIKGGLLEGVTATVEQIETLSKLPSREGLLSMLLSVLQAPMRNTASVLYQANPALRLAYALNAVAETK